jgi:hypothetical protein
MEEIFFACPFRGFVNRQIFGVHGFSRQRCMKLAARRGRSKLKFGNGLATSEPLAITAWTGARPLSGALRL